MVTLCKKYSRDTPKGSGIKATATQNEFVKYHPLICSGKFIAIKISLSGRYWVLFH